MPYLYLAFAIVAEVIATTALKASQSFSRPVPSVIVVIGYACAFYFLSRCIQHLHVGVVYAVWSGIGIVLITVLGFLLYGERIDAPGVLGMALIIAGVVVLHVFSAASAQH